MGSWPGGPTLIRPQSVGLGTLEANFGSTQVDFSGRASGDPSKVADASVSTANNTAQLLVETRMVRQAIEVVAGNTMPTRGGSHRRVATKPHKA